MGLTFLLASIIFVFGLCVGSFVNVVVLRSLRGEEFIRGRSHCDVCKRELLWYELIPLISYVMLRGKCRTCHAEIDIMHPIVELLTGSLFLWWFLIGFAFFRLTANPFSVIQPLFWLLVGVLLLVIVVIDLKAMIIPDWAIVALSFLTLAYRSSLMIAGIDRPIDFAWSVFGASLALGFFLFLWLVTKRRGMGFGDVKLVFALALLLHWPQVGVALFLSFVIGAVVGVVLLALRRTRFGVPLPFGPFLVTGTVIALLWGEALLRWYIQQL